MAKIERSALVMHPVETMFDLVNDVASYPQYMDGCVGSEILESAANHMLARLDLKKSGVGLSFVTRNGLSRPQSILITLEDGPFRSLTGVWEFKALTAQACKVSLNLTFEFKNKGVAAAGAKLFANVTNNLVGSLCRRADQLSKLSDVPDGGC